MPGGAPRAVFASSTCLQASITGFGISSRIAPLARQASCAEASLGPTAERLAGAAELTLDCVDDLGVSRRRVVVGAADPRLGALIATGLVAPARRTPFLGPLLVATRPNVGRPIAYLGRASGRDRSTLQQPARRRSRGT